MQISLNVKQVDTLTDFLANMAVAWFIAAFIKPESISYVLIYTGYGALALYGALFLKGGR